MGRCIVCTGFGLLLLINPFIMFISSFFFLSSFQTLKYFVAIVRPTKLRLGTHMGNGLTYRVYRATATAAYLSLYFLFLHFSFSPFFVIKDFSGTTAPRIL